MNNQTCHLSCRLIPHRDHLSLRHTQTNETGYTRLSYQEASALHDCRNPTAPHPRPNSSPYHNAAHQQQFRLRAGLFEISDSQRRRLGSRRSLPATWPLYTHSYVHWQAHNMRTTCSAATPTPRPRLLAGASHPPPSPTHTSRSFKIFVLTLARPRTPIFLRPKPLPLPTP